MKKTLLGAAVALILLIFVIPLFLAKTFQVEQNLEILAPFEMTFEKVANVHSWKDWSTWHQGEAAVAFEASGTPGVVGSAFNWKGPLIGQGTQTLIALETNSSLRFQLEFKKPQATSVQSYWRFVDTGDGGTSVTWGIEGELAYPLERLFAVFIPGKLENNMSGLLEALKKHLESDNSPKK